MEFKYAATNSYTAEIEIEAIGNVCIEAITSMGAMYYIMIHTHAGMTQVFEYGPTLVDLEYLPHNFTMNYERFEYSEPLVSRKIRSFLNNPKKNIFQAKIVSMEEVMQNCPNIIKFVKEKFVYGTKDTGLDW